jgi:hypothetical protein
MTSPLARWLAARLRAIASAGVYGSSWCHPDAKRILGEFVAFHSTSVTTRWWRQRLQVGQARCPSIEALDHT